MSDSIAINQKKVMPRRMTRAWLVCLSAGLFFFYEFFQLNLFDVINAPLRQFFQIDAVQLGWMSSAYLWANVLFLLPAGILLDKYSARKLILVSMGLCVVATAGFALTNSFFLATFFRFLTGVGNAFCFLSCVVLVSRWFPSQRQAFVIGCIVTLAFIGGMTAHTPLAYLNEQYGWQNALLIDAVVGLIIFIWIFCVVKDKPNTEKEAHKSHSSVNRVRSWEALKNRQNWLCGLYTACLNLPIMVLGALWGGSYLRAVYHLPQMTASNTVSLIFIGSIIGSPIVGWLSDFWGKRKPLMMIGAIATFITMIPLLGNWQYPQVLLSGLFLLLGIFSSTQVIAYPMIAESNLAKYTGAATGIASVIIMGGAGIAQVLFGMLLRFYADEHVMNYTSAHYHFALWLFPVATFIGLIAICFTHETFCQSQDQRS